MWKELETTTLRLGILTDSTIRRASCGKYNELPYIQEDSRHPFQDIDKDHLQQEDIHCTMTGEKLMGDPDKYSSPKGINNLESQTTTYKDYLESIGEGTRRFP